MYSWNSACRTTKNFPRRVLCSGYDSCEKSDKNISCVGGISWGAILDLESANSIICRNGKKFKYDRSSQCLEVQKIGFSSEKWIFEQFQGIENAVCADTGTSLCYRKQTVPEFNGLTFSEVAISSIDELKKIKKGSKDNLVLHYVYDDDGDKYVPYLGQAFNYNDFRIVHAQVSRPESEEPSLFFITFLNKVVGYIKYNVLTDKEMDPEFYLITSQKKMGPPRAEFEIFYNSNKIRLGAGRVWHLDESGLYKFIFIKRDLSKSHKYQKRIGSSASAVSILLNSSLIDSIERERNEKQAEENKVKNKVLKKISL